MTDESTFRARCDACRRLMDGTGCDPLDCAVDNEVRARTPWDRNYACSDCETPEGGYHHRGCDLDVCQHGQALTCVTCDLVLSDGTRVMAGTTGAIAFALKNGFR